ncbi:hypothetical protein HK101_007167 [Irineochytrium annulatum]|nr:hypothetical protein HK101_007167 [Irineochytrium annulatum]
MFHRKGKAAACDTDTAAREQEPPKSQQTDSRSRHDAENAEDSANGAGEVPSTKGIHVESVTPCPLDVIPSKKSEEAMKLQNATAKPRPAAQSAGAAFVAGGQRGVLGSWRGMGQSLESAAQGQSEQESDGLPPARSNSADARRASRTAVATRSSTPPPLGRRASDPAVQSEQQLGRSEATERKDTSCEDYVSKVRQMETDVPDLQSPAVQAYVRPLKATVDCMSQQMQNQAGDAAQLAIDQQRKTEEAQAKLADALQLLENERARVNGLVALRDDMDSQLKELMSKLNEIEKAKNNTEGILHTENVRANNMNAEMNKVIAENAALRAHVDEFGKQTPDESCDVDRSESDKFRAECEKLQLALRQKDAQLSELTEAPHLLQHQKEQVAPGEQMEAAAAASEELGQLHNKLKVQEEERGMLEGQIASLRHQNEELTGRIQELESAMKVAQGGTMRGEEMAAEETRQELKMRDLRVNELEIQNERLRMESERRLKELSTGGWQMKQVKEELARKGEEMEELRREKDVQQDKAQALEETIKSVMRLVTESKAKHDNEEVATKQAFVRLNEEVSRARSSNETLSGHFQDLVSSLTNVCKIPSSSSNTTARRDSRTPSMRRSRMWNFGSGGDRTSGPSGPTPPTSPNRGRSSYALSDDYETQQQQQPQQQQQAAEGEVVPSSSDVGGDMGRRRSTRQTLSDGISMIVSRPTCAAAGLQQQHGAKSARVDLPARERTQPSSGRGHTANGTYVWMS